MSLAYKVAQILAAVFFSFFLIDIVTIMLCYVLFSQWRLTVI